jgi:hypothetical protein
MTMLIKTNHKKSMEKISMQYQCNLNVRPLRPARFVAAISDELVSGPFSSAAGPSDTEMHQWKIERCVKVLLADYDNTMYEKGRLTGWF